MRIITARVPGAARLARPPELTRMARLRLQWMGQYKSHGGNAAFTIRHFGISRQTFYRWKRRLDPHRLESLKERSHRPRELALAVLHQGPVDSPELAVRAAIVRESKEKGV